MIIPVGPARNLASQAAFSSLVGLPLRSILGKKYKPSLGKEVRSVETIRSSLDIRLKPIPLSSTMCEMPPHTNMVAAPASAAISHLYKNFILAHLAYHRTCRAGASSGVSSDGDWLSSSRTE